MNSPDGGCIVDTDDKSMRTIIVCVGELDLRTAAAMTLAVRELDPRTRSITFDLRAVTFADAAGLQPIATAIELFGRRNVSVQDPTETVRSILELTHLIDELRDD